MQGRRPRITLHFIRATAAWRLAPNPLYDYWLALMSVARLITAFGRTSR